MGIRLKVIRKRGITSLKRKHISEHHKGTTRIKKLKKSTLKNSAKLERKFKVKPHEKTVKIQKFYDSEVDIFADTKLFADQKPSHTLVFDNVQSSVSAMLQLRDAKTSSKNVPLFMDEGQPVYMVVKCIRIPEMCNQHFRFRLPHPLIDESSNVCLFVPDLKKGSHIDHEPTIEYYKNFLEKNNVTGISQVMPLRQVRVEYDQYELRRRLVSQFDLFLSDGRIAGHMLQLLGKEIYKRRKLPVPVNMRVKNLKVEFEISLSKTLMMMNAGGNKAALKIGHTRHSVTQLSENIMAVAQCLAERYPGGWNNIRALHIHLQNSTLIPVYVSLKSSNEVSVPIVKPVIPKKAKPVEGELSTFPGTHVTVMPSGEVIVKKMDRTKEDIDLGLSDSDFEEYNTDEEMDVGSEDELPTVRADEKKKVEPQPDPEKEKESADSDDGNEQAVEAAEDAYLSEWTKQWNANIENSNKRKEHGEHKPSKKDKTESVGSPSLPSRKSTQKKGQKVGNRKKLLTKVATKKTEQVSQNDAAVK